nr:thioesterase family protein [Brevibacillus sp. LEMMJ03]
MSVRPIIRNARRKNSRILPNIPNEYSLSGGDSLYWKQDRRRERGAMGMQHLFDLVVRSTDIDVIGHVNNAKYLEYMEWARFDWMCRQGFTLEELKRRQIMPVVVSIQINYRKELRMLEQVQVRTSVVKIGEKSFVVRHELYNQRDERAADADVTMVMIDAVQRRSVPLPDDLARALADALPSGQASG